MTMISYCLFHCLNLVWTSGFLRKDFSFKISNCISRNHWQNVHGFLPFSIRNISVNISCHSRAEVTSRLQKMMQSHCSEALRLLTMGSHALEAGHYRDVRRVDTGLPLPRIIYWKEITMTLPHIGNLLNFLNDFWNIVIHEVWILETIPMDRLM